MNFEVSKYQNQNLDIMTTFIKSAFIITMIFGISSYTHAQNSSQMTEERNISTVELTSFKLKDGTNEIEFIQVADQMQKEFLNKQIGFKNRTLVKGKNGWTDIVSWESEETFQNAMQKAESAAAVAPFMQMIDFNSVKMNLTEIKMNTN